MRGQGTYGNQAPQNVRGERIHTNQVLQNVRGKGTHVYQVPQNMRGERTHTNQAPQNVEARGLTVIKNLEIIIFSNNVEYKWNIKLFRNFIIVSEISFEFLVSINGMQNE